MLAEVLDCSSDIAPSFFEATTAAAFLAFARTPADAAVIEVGLGGRLDATNVIETPIVCGIAQLGIDHQSFLGDDAVTIAGEKAGIAKPDVPLVSMDYAEPQARRVSDIAENAGAPWYPKGSDWHAATYRDQLHYRDKAGKLSVPQPRLPGQHQAMNAALAIAMLRHQSAIAVPDSAIRAAMGWADWSARLQKLADGPITRLAPNIPIWIDGCHNPDCAQPVAEEIGRLLGKDDHLHIIAGILANKDAEGTLQPFFARATSFQTVPIAGHLHHSPDTLAQWLREQKRDAEPADSLEQAIQAINSRDRPSAILVLGSLYLAGEVLRLNEQIPE